MPSFLSPILQEPDARHALRNRRTGRILATVLEPAFDSKSRRRGLLGRDALPDNAALVIAPCNSIHTFFMRFPIDVVFAARDGRVRKTYIGLPAWRLGFALGAFAAIELPVGVIARSETRADDGLEIVKI